MNFHGFVQIYTGNGKGKTTAALGQALRAAGAGMRSYIIQFMKKGNYSELQAVEKYLAEMITIEQFGLPNFHHQHQGVRPEEVEVAMQGVQRAYEIFANPDIRLIILDEINTLLHFKIIPLSTIIELIAKRPADKELILTGRYAPAELIARADLVSEIIELKHYYRQGITSRRGIEC